MKQGLRKPVERNHLAPVDRSAAESINLVLMDLLTALLALSPEADVCVSPESPQNALLLRIKGFIRQNLGDPGLTPTSVAAAHHISTRYLHRLFQGQDTTVAALIRRQRLERCRHDLADATLAHLPINSVAAYWGFTEPSVFSRTFRAAYGMAPRDYRDARTRTARSAAS